MSDAEQPPSKGALTGARIVAAMIGFLCLFLGLQFLITGFQNGDQLSILFGVFIFSLFFSFMGAAWRVPAQGPLSRTVTVTKCAKCDYTEVRDFQKGDYIYKTIGKCKECDGELFIKTIYTIPLQKTQLSAS